MLCMGLRGKVLNGKIVVEEALPEGLEVEVTLPHSDEEPAIDEELEAELDIAAAELARGEGIPAEEVLDTWEDE